MRLLGIESSCDDTAAAVLDWSEGDLPKILSSVVEGQERLHADFGGVVPEIAARAHAERLDHVIEAALAQAGTGLADLDGIAVTAGPGLIGGVVSGVMTAKGIAAATGLPIIGVNHLAGHALSPRMVADVPYPYLTLLVSGGHCQFLIVKAADSFERLGGTIDDAPGEAFDKIARVLGLNQPGGPAIEREAAQGEARFPLPRPLLDREGCDMSFSGLKTAMLRLIAQVSSDGKIAPKERADLCASFQATIAAILTEKTRRALVIFGEKTGLPSRLAVAGGVAANQTIRTALAGLAEGAGGRFVAPPMALCTDNGAMIAYAGAELLALGVRSGLDLGARPRWPLDAQAAPLLGSGRKGAKA